MPIDIENLEIVMMDTRDVIPYWRNPRKNDKTVDALCETIPKNGFNVPIVIDKHNVVVKGHARLRAAKRLGLEKVPCIVSRASDEVNKADRIADNKIQEMSSWDFAKRDLEFEKLGDKLAFGHIFHPEQMKEVSEAALDVPAFEYKATELDFSQVGDSGDDEPTRHEHPPVPVFVDIPDTYEPPHESNATPQASHPQDPHNDAPPVPAQPEKRRFRTLCPYCGKVVTIDV